MIGGSDGLEIDRDHMRVRNQTVRIILVEDPELVANFLRWLHGLYAHSRHLDREFPAGLWARCLETVEPRLSHSLSLVAVSWSINSTNKVQFRAGLYNDLIADCLIETNSSQIFTSPPEIILYSFMHSWHF